MWIKRSDWNNLQDKVYTLQREMSVLKNELGYTELYQNGSSLGKKLLYWEQLLDFLNIEWEKSSEEGFIKKK